MEGFNKIYGRALDCVLVPGSFRPNSSSGIVSGSTKGQGFSVARTSAGLYTVTFAEKWPAQGSGLKGPGLLSFHAGLRCRAAEPATIAVGSIVSQSAKTAQIRVFQAATGTVTPSGGALTKGPGNIPLDVTALRNVSSDDIPASAADETAATPDLNSGGYLSKTTSPILERANGATDKALRVSWVADAVEEVQFPPISLPADLDRTADVLVKLWISKSANANADAVIDVQAFDGIGDTEMGGNTAALATAALTEYSVTLAAADIGDSSGILNLALVPGAHNSDAIYLHAARVEYTRKTWAVSAVTATGTGQVWALADLAADADNEVEFLAVIQDNLSGV